ncbi:MAG: C-terminal target protein [Bacteroidota bacterium]|nr:C-terminal target protein [Bacteroidota bacterium]
MKKELYFLIVIFAMLALEAKAGNASEKDREALLDETSITTNSIIGSPFCPGTFIQVSFTASGTFNNGNAFSAELSNENGAFVDTKLLGTLVGVSGGTINAQIPFIITPSSRYRIRVVSSNPYYEGSDNGSNLTLSMPPIPDFSGPLETCSEYIETYTSSNTIGMQNEWHLTGGLFVGDSTGSKVKVRWNWENYGTLKVITKNASGCADSTMKTISIAPIPVPVIAGTTSICMNNTARYATSRMPGIDCEWSVAGGTIVSSATSDDEIEVLWDKVGSSTVTLKETSTATGCHGQKYLEVSVNPLPIVQFNGLDKVCAGTVATYNTTIEQGIINQWQVKHGIVVTEAQDKIIIRWSSPDFIGQVKLIKYFDLSGCKDSLVQDVDISPLPKPQIEGNSSAGEGNIEVYLSKNNVGMLNLWSVEGGEISGSATETEVRILWGEKGNGTIVLQQTSAVTGCIDSSKLSVIINESTAPNISGTRAICSNEKASYLTTPKTGIDYKWEVSGGIIEGSSDSCKIEVQWGNAGEGKIMLIAINSVSEKKDTSYLDVTIYSIPPKPIITEEGNELISSIENGNQWYLNGADIPGEVSRTYTPKGTGKYTVQVTDENGCKSEMSDIFDFISGVNEDSEINNLRIYPNPAADYLTIESLDKNSYPILISISNLIGDELISISIESSRQIIDLREIPSGLYLLRIKIGSNIYSKKLIISR